MLHCFLRSTTDLPRGDGHGDGSPLHQSRVGLMQGLVHVHQSVDDGLPVAGGGGEPLVHYGEVLGQRPVPALQVHAARELLADLGELHYIIDLFKHHH